MKTIHDFLPISKEDLLDREWYYYDFLLITGDAYVDHPSFGTAIISRVLEDLGFRVAILAQPDWKNVASFTALGKPRYGVLVNGGNIDSMVAHYTAAMTTPTPPAARPACAPTAPPSSMATRSGRSGGTSPSSSAA